MIFNLFSSSIYINSNFLFITALLLIFLPFSVNNENKKYGNCTYIGVFITISVIVCFQSISFKLVYPYLVQFTSMSKNVFLFNIFEGISRLVHDGLVNEFELMGWIIDGINWVSNYRMIGI